MILKWIEVKTNSQIILPLKRTVDSNRVKYIVKTKDLFLFHDSIKNKLLIDWVGVSSSSEYFILVNIDKDV